jgi:phosphatidylserine/phosphatidylglycerophosphate/cardiolipin synthase-like enzyme
MPDVEAHSTATLEPATETREPVARDLPGLESRYFPPPGGTDVAPVSRRSTVVPIIDGEKYFKQLKARIDSLQAGDAWYVTGWLFDSDFEFEDDDKLVDLLSDCAAAGVDVRVIVWANRQVLDYPTIAGAVADGYDDIIKGNIHFAETLRGKPSLAGRVLVDWSGNAASSHHMKLNVFSISGSLTAFVGGIDYESLRLDGPPHVFDHNNDIPGWHDAGVRVTGEAAQRVLDTVVTRWTEASTLSAATYDIGNGDEDYNDPTTLVPLTPPGVGTLPAKSSSTSIQVVRSFPDSKEFGFVKNKRWSTLPRTGVHETKKTFKAMLKAAQRYIYIEDQGFNAVDSLFPSLVAACKRGVKVIAVLPGMPDPLDGTAPLPPVVSSEVRTGLLGKLSRDKQKNLSIWQHKEAVIHSKLVLIDDELMSIGSANFMDRSMEFTYQGDDAECSVVAVSTGKLVRDLRVRLWAEHFGVSGAGPEADLRDLGKSLAIWRKEWGTGVSFALPGPNLVSVFPGAGSGGSGSGGSSGGSGSSSGGSKP